MAYATPIVFVVHDDVSVRESLELLIESAGWESQTFGSAQEFLAHPRVQAGPSCYDAGEATVRTMKEGAVAFLTKPFDANALLRAIEHAIGRSRVTLRREGEA